MSDVLQNMAVILIGGVLGTFVLVYAVALVMLLGEKIKDWMRRG